MMPTNPGAVPIVVFLVVVVVVFTLCWRRDENYVVNFTTLPFDDVMTTVTSKQTNGRDVTPTLSLISFSSERRS